MEPGTDVATLRTLPGFDERIYTEGIDLYSKLSVATYCRHAQKLLNGPSPQKRLEVAGGVRAVCNSFPLYAASSDGLVPVTLFYLVTLVEGVLTPLLRPLVDLCEAAGHRGPQNDKGQYKELDDATSKVGPAIKFLDTYGPPILGQSPIIAGSISRYHQEHLSQLRNGVAHFNFRLEIVRHGARVDGLLGKVISKLVQLHNPAAGELVDMERSVVRYENRPDRAVTKNSKSRTFKDVRDLTSHVETFAMTLQFSFIEAGRNFGDGIRIFACDRCKEGHVVMVSTERHVECPACGHTGSL